MKGWHRLARKKRIILILILCLISAPVLAAAVWKSALDPKRGTVDSPRTTAPLDTVLTQQEARCDLDYMYDKLRTRHPAWIIEPHGICSRVEKQYLRERAGFEDTLTVLDLWQSCRRILAILNDGHTSIYENCARYRVIDNQQDFDSADDLIAVNGEPAENVFARFCEMNSSETEATDRACFEDALRQENYLAMMGVDISDGVTFTFRDEKEEVSTRHFSFISEDDQSKTEESLTWRTDADAGTALFDLSTCVFDEEYVNETQNFFRSVKEDACSKIIVDLRGNPGGDSRVIDEFLRHLDIDSYRTSAFVSRDGPFLVRHSGTLKKNDRYDSAYDGSLYVLTDSRTFSSAMDFAMYIQDNHLGKVVGEASGNLPDSYGDTLYFSLPRSGLWLTVSSKKWERIDRNLAGKPVMPDIPCDPKDALYTAMRN